MLSRRALAGACSADPSVALSSCTHARRCARHFHSSRYRRAEDSTPKQAPATRSQRAPNVSKPEKTTSSNGEGLSIQQAMTSRIAQAGPPGQRLNFTPRQNTTPRQGTGITHRKTPRSGNAPKLNENKPQTSNAVGRPTIAVPEEKRGRGSRKAAIQESAEEDLEESQDVTNSNADALANISDEALIDSAKKVAYTRSAAATVSGITYNPSQPSTSQIHSEGSGTAVPTASNVLNVIESHLRSLAPRTRPGHKSLQQDHLHSKLKQEQYAYVTPSEKQFLDLRGPDARSGSEPAPFRPLSQQMRIKALDRLVKGKYDAEGVLSGEKKYAHGALEQVERLTMLNGTYLSGDTQRVMEKVRKLVPATPVKTAAAPRAKA